MLNFYPNYNINSGLSFGVNYKELAKYAKRQGCKFVRSGKGSHNIWQRITKGGRVLKSVLPKHPSKELSSGVIKSFCEQLGIPKYI